MMTSRASRLAAAASLALCLLSAGAASALAHPAFGGPVDPGAVPGTLPTGVDLSAYALVIMAVLAVIGAARGVKGATRAIVVTGMAVLLFGPAWAKVASVINKQWKLLYAGVQVSAGTGEPAEVFASMSAMKPIVPATGTNAAVWQIALFALVVLLVGYRVFGSIAARPAGGGQPGAPRMPRVIDRLVGALIGGLTGLLVAHFVLPRIVPGARISIVDPRLTIAAAAAPYAPMIFFGVVVLLIFFGVKSLGGSAPRFKVYN